MSGGGPRGPPRLHGMPMTHCCRLLLSLLAALVLAQAGEAQEMRTLVRERSSDVLSPAVADALGRSPRVRAWIYFTDKAVFDSPTLQQRLGALTRELSPRARSRREIRGVPLGIRDLPVHAAYAEAVAATGVDVRHLSRWFNAMSVVASRVELMRVGRLPYVARIDVVRGVPERPPAPDGSAPPQTGGDRLGIDPDVLFYGFDPVQYEKAQIAEAHAAGYTGAGVLIAMFDGGFDPDHPALLELPLVAEHDFVQGDDVTSDQPNNSPPDVTQFGNLNMCHGTATWSTCGGYLPGRHVGVAFGASFAIAKTEYGPYERHVEEDNWAAAAEWADMLGADIISSSLGYRYDFDDAPGEYAWEQLDGRTTIVAQAANIAAQVGMVVVNSVGNDQFRGQRSLNSPSDSDSVLAVGAVIPVSEVITDFSSLGPAAPVCPTCPERIKPDVLAQGQLVHAGTAEGCYDLEPFYTDDNGPFYDQTNISGTSFSCPITAGAAAILLEAHPSWQPYEVRYALKQTANDFARGIQPSITRGYGVIRLMDAMAIQGLGGALQPLRPGPFDLVGPEPFSETGTAMTGSTPTFTWHAAGPGRFNLPRRYDLELSPSLHFDVDVIDMQDVTDTTVTLDQALTEEGFYYWRVRAEDDSADEEPEFPRESRQRWRILFDQPPQPFALVYPIDDQVVTSSLSPEITWRQSLDASPTDTVRYTLVIAQTPSFLNPRSFSGIRDTTFTPSASDPLSEAQSYFWRVRARDRFGAETISATESFATGAFPPAGFDLESPSVGDTVRTLRPTLRWAEAIDPNPHDAVLYQVLIGDAPDAVDQSIGQASATQLRVPAGELTDDALVYWRVVAEDSYGNETPSAVASFRTWLAPLPFALSSPADGATVYGDAVTCAWEPAVDETPGDEVTYRVTFYADETLSTVLTTSDPVTGTSVRTDLPDDAPETIYWRVRATDTTDRSTWSASTRHFMRSPAAPAFAARAFPNPFDPRQAAFAVTYDVPADLGGQIVRIAIHDVIGRVVRVLLDEPATIGTAHSVSWNGRSANGTRVPAGVYFVRVTLGAEEERSRVVVINR